MRRSLTPFLIFLFLIGLAKPGLFFAQENIVGEGEHKGFIINEGLQVFRVGPIRPGQTIEVFCTPQWTKEKGGKVEWRLQDQDGITLKAARQSNPEAEPALMEWTSNSLPRPKAYSIYVQGMDGDFPGEILGAVTLRIFLWDQNDGNSGTDAPETYEKALLLPISEPGTYLFEECFMSGTADIYDIYKIPIKPNHSLTLTAKPLQWKGVDPKGKVRWEFLNKSFRRLKGGDSLFPHTSPFTVKIFYPQVKADTKEAFYYLFVKVEGEVSLIYALHAEMKEGR